MNLGKSLLGLGTLTAAIALTGGLALTVATGVSAQTPAPTASPAPTPIPGGGPSAVPLARFFGSVTNNGVPVAAGASVTVSIGSASCGTGSVTTPGNYSVDVQAIPGCVGGGTTATFAVNGQKANETGTIPAVSGAVQLNLTVAQATPTPSPTAAPTLAPTAPPPSATPRPPAATPTQAPTAVVPARPPTTGLGGGTAQQKPAGPSVAQKPVAPQPGAVAAAPAARPALPNTGTGGLSAVTSAGGSVSGWLLLGVLMATFAAGATVVVRKRS